MTPIDAEGNEIIAFFINSEQLAPPPGEGWSLMAVTAESGYEGPECHGSGGLWCVWARPRGMDDSQRSLQERVAMAIKELLERWRSRAAARDGCCDEPDAIRECADELESEMRTVMVLRPVPK